MIHLPRLLADFLPYYLRHLVAQPYRPPSSAKDATGLAGKAGRRHHIAMYDAVLEIMLKGYSESAGIQLRPETGQVAVKLMHLGFAFDDEFERRTADGQRLTFDDIFGGANVQRLLGEWRGYMGQFDTYPSIREFLFSYVTSLYASYQSGTERPDWRASFDDLITAAEWDSGGLLVTLAHVVGRFHSVPPPQDVIRQFSSLGATAKLADDIVDLQSDLAAKRPNLLAALAREDERELAQVTEALTARRRMSSRWWRRHCPHTYGKLSTVYEQHQATLTARSLRLASDLMWTPTLIGHSSVTDTRGRV